MLPWSWQIASRFLKRNSGVAGAQELQNEGYRNFGEEFYRRLGTAEPMAIIAFSDN
jgi:hypothetical protein